jgi:integrase
VLTRDEIRKVFSHLHGTSKLMAGLFYGSGLRLLECARLRIKDIDLATLRITVRDAKGGKDRPTMLPVAEPIRRHLAKVRAQHDEDLAEGFGAVHLPYALARKYPSANRQWAWQYLFPSSRVSIDPRSGKKQRHHIAESVVHTGSPRRSGKVWSKQIGHLPQPSSFLCHSSPGKRIRHSHGSGASRPQGCEHDDDLYTCA